MTSKAGQMVGLPPKPFFYTIEQIATLLDVEEKWVKTTLLFYEGRSVGACPKDRLLSRNLAPSGETPVWRVAERNFVQWLRFKGYRFHERGYIK